MIPVGKILESNVLRSKLGFWRMAFVILAIASLFFYFGRGNTPADFLSGKYVAKVDINGFISDDDDYTGFISELGKNKNISAVIFRVNSPGGSLIGSEKLYEAILSVGKVKPIVSLMDGMATSGGYMAAIASDHIIARSSSITGSIGVIVQYFGIYDLAKKVGVTLRAIKSSPLKASPSPLENASETSFDELKLVVDAAYEHFVSLVKSRRSVIKDEERAFSGRVFLGDEAVSLGLVDEIGNDSTAIDWLKSKGVNTKNVRLLRYDGAADSITSNKFYKTLGLVVSMLSAGSLSKISELSFQNSSGLMAIHSFDW